MMALSCGCGGSDELDLVALLEVTMAFL